MAAGRLRGDYICNHISESYKCYLPVFTLLLLGQDCIASTVPFSSLCLPLSPNSECMHPMPSNYECICFSPFLVPTLQKGLLCCTGLEDFIIGKSRHSLRVIARQPGICTVIFTVHITSHTSEAAYQIWARQKELGWKPWNQLNCKFVSFSSRSKTVTCNTRRQMGDLGRPCNSLTTFSKGFSCFSNQPSHQRNDIISLRFLESWHRNRYSYSFIHEFIYSFVHLCIHSFNGDILSAYCSRH